MNIEFGMKLKVVKDIYYVVEDSIDECSYLTKEELFNSVSHVLVEGDIWEVVGGDWDDEMGAKCIEGKWKDEYSEGWWDLDDMINKGAFEVIGE